MFTNHRKESPGAFQQTLKTLEDKGIKFKLIKKDDYIFGINPKKEVIFRYDKEEYRLDYDERLMNKVFESFSEYINDFQ